MQTKISSAFQQVNDPKTLKSSFSKAEEYLAKNSLYYLNTQVLGFDRLSLEPHLTVCDFVDGMTNVERLLLLMSRRSFKTTGISVGKPIQRILNDPNDMVNICGQERNYSVDILTQIKGQLETNEKLKRLNHGDFRKRRSGWKEYEIYVKGRTNWTAKEPSIGTSGIDSIKAGPHYRLIIFDDVESDSNTNTIEACAKLISNYIKMSPMLTSDGKMIMVGTPWSLDGLYIYILEHISEYKHFKILFGQAQKVSGILPETGAPVLRLPKGPEGTYLMPKWLPPKQLEDEEAKDPVFYASQYLISFITGAAQEFRLEWWHYIKRTDLMSLLPHLRIFATLDPGYSKAATADYTAIIVAGVDKLNNIFIIRIIHDRMTPDEITNHFYDLYRTYGISKIGVEANGIQTVFEWIFQKAAAERGFLPIFPLKERSASKDSRIRGLIPPYKEGKVYHITDDGKTCCQEQKILESQQRRFPTGKKHRDAIDAESMLLEVIDFYSSLQQATKKFKRRRPICSTTGY